MYKFCPVCRGVFQSVQYNLLVCQKCGYRFFLNSVPTVSGLLVNSRGEVMLVERSREPGKGLLDLPGGFIDLGEKAEGALARELKEEIDYIASDYEYVGSYPGRYWYQNIDTYTLNLLFKVSVADEVSYIPADDVARVMFFPIRDIPYNRIAFDWVKDALVDRFD